jgi:hypothetical protein
MPAEMDHVICLGMDGSCCVNYLWMGLEMDRVIYQEMAPAIYSVIHRGMVQLSYHDCCQGTGPEIMNPVIRSEIFHRMGFEMDNTIWRGMDQEKDLMTFYPEMNQEMDLEICET